MSPGKGDSHWGDPRGYRGLCESPAAVAVSAGDTALLSHISCAPQSLRPEVKGWGPQVTPRSKRMMLLGFIVSGGHRVGHACGLDGRRGEVGIEDGEGARRPAPSINMES